MELAERFQGCLLGVMLGDVIGAPVEGESARYIAKTFRDVEGIVALKSVPEVLGGRWTCGRFTDDTQLSLCLAEWLLEDVPLNTRPEPVYGEKLLWRFHHAYHPGRRYGSGAARILQAVPECQEWQALATLMFPGGSYGNGSAMRVAPLAMVFHRNLRELVAWSKLASMTTHSHPMALAGSALQAAAIALVLQGFPPHPAGAFLDRALEAVQRFGSPSWPVGAYREALAKVAQGVSDGASGREMGEVLGNGVEAIETVPLGLFCYLANPWDFRATIESAIFAGGDVDTTGAMAGALCGASVGLAGLPKTWLAKVCETEYTPGRVAALARALNERASQG